MHNRIRGICLTAGLLTAFAEAPALSSTITIDSDMSDWGVTVADNNGSDFSSPNPTIGLVASFTEDSNDFAGDGGYVGPQLRRSELRRGIHGHGAAGQRDVSRDRYRSAP